MNIFKVKWFPLPHLPHHLNLVFEPGAVIIVTIIVIIIIIIIMIIIT